MKKISTVIFDLDGTLADTSRLIFASFRHVARTYTGKLYTDREILALFGPTEEVAIANLVGGDRAEEAVEEFHRFYAASHAELARGHEGIGEALSFLKSRGVLLALFTGKGKRTTLVTLARLGYSGFFDLLVTGDDVKRHKPSADGIRKVLETWRLEPDEALMVGDSPADIIAAREAGMKVVSVLWDAFAQHTTPRPEPDFSFSSVRDFSEFLETVFTEQAAGAP
ncbi:MAG TPA: HAD-IA family hydrolase [Bacteroidota bacterium]|nr:HAD-IA family hydrolase [Bacteroidota bacterium]